MRKIALIIGNTEYQDPKLVKLASPKADVDQLAAVLKDPDVGAFDEVQELVDESQGVVSRA
ncbi:MAG TPA: caspase family protein, partial [Polyangiaceae bacterium]|nr:caspase family protein [Polyangiaceae bacterium]